jgi:hypothetical protein
MTMLSLLNAFNQTMSQMMPNLLPKAFYAYQEAVKSLGYDPDLMLLTKEEFDQFHQQLLMQKQREAQQQPPQDPTIMATVNLLNAQAEEQKASAQNKLAQILKIKADAQKSMSDATHTAVETKHIPEKMKMEAQDKRDNRLMTMQMNRENNQVKSEQSKPKDKSQ